MERSQGSGVADLRSIVSFILHGLRARHLFLLLAMLLLLLPPLLLSMLLSMLLLLCELRLHCHLLGSSLLFSCRVQVWPGNIPT